MSGSPADGNAGIAEPPITEGLEQAIRELADHVQASLSPGQDQIGAATALAAGSRRIRLCGSGPDLDAAHAGGWLLRDIGVSALAHHSFDLAEFTTGFEPGDLIIGIDLIGDESVGRAIRLATDSGLSTVGITNRELTPYSPSVILPAGATDRPLLATPALPAALLASMVSRIEPESTTARSLAALPDALREMEAARPVAREVAEEAGQDGRRIVIGAVGPALWAASAGARLIRRAAGVPVEVDHLQSLTSATSILAGGDIVIEIDPPPGEHELSDRLQTLVKDRKLRRWRIGGTAEGLAWHSPGPAVSPMLAPFGALVALYWLAVELAGRPGAEAADA